MATVVNVHEAKTHLSRILARVEAGEEIVIARGDERVSAPAARAIGDGAAEVFVSAASLWEIAIKARLGRLEVDGDPFDRMLVAQAQAEGLAIVTADREIASHGVETVW